MLARAARPKLTLTVPTITSPTVFSSAPKSPFPTSTTTSSSTHLSPSAAISPSCTSPTTRNTALNSRRHFATATASLTPRTPVAPIPASSQTKGGILKKAGCACNHTASSGRVQGKKISFSKEASVTVVSPMPGDYHGDYVRMRGEGAWRS